MGKGCTQTGFRREGNWPMAQARLVNATKATGRRRPADSAKATGRWQLGNGAGDGNRTRTASLEGWDSTIELHPRRAEPNGTAADAQSFTRGDTDRC